MCARVRVPARAFTLCGSVFVSLCIASVSIDLQ